ncbi:hypothetical protein HDK64DRAFT_1584 [Phyllosticta capitalensis]
MPPNSSSGPVSSSSKTNYTKAAVTPVSSWIRTSKKAVLRLGDLTTVFTPPSDCRKVYRASSYVTNTLSSNGTIISETSLFSLGQRGKRCSNTVTLDEASCWPSSTSFQSNNDPPGLGFFSPGLFCPVGYYTACASIADGGAYSNFSMYSFGFVAGAGETVAGCCPSGYQCATTSSIGEIQGCVSVAGPLSSLAECTLTTFWSPSSLSSSWTINTSVSGGLATPTTSIQAVVDINTIVILQAPLIQLNWKAEDLALNSSFATTSLNPGPVSTASTGEKHSNGLSTSAVISISVVVPLVCLGILIGLVVWYLRRRKLGRLLAQQQEQERLDDEKSNHKFHGPELPHEGSAIVELPQPSAEMSDPHAEQFMQAQKKPAELPPDDV